VLLDVAMPVMDGLQALPLIRGICPNAALVMLILSTDPRWGSWLLLHVTMRSS